MSLKHAPNEERARATTDKAKNTVQQAKGNGKEFVGRATANKKQRADGKVDQRKGDLKPAGEKVKDALHQ